MSEHSKTTFWGIIKGIVKAVIGIFVLLQVIVFLLILVGFLGIMTGTMNEVGGKGSSGASIAVPDGAAFVLNPRGVLVEEAAVVDPFEDALAEAYGSSRPRQIALEDVVRSIQFAKEDKRIKAMVLDLGGFGIPSIYASKMQVIADEIDSFKESGKQVIAVGDYYTQEQYYLAAHADKVFLNDYGNLLIMGLGNYRTYYNELLTEKLKVTNHVFRVGTFKSALEPFLRNDMSEPAKEANIAYLNVLWDAYTSGVETARGLEDGSIDNFTNNAPEFMAMVNGDLAQLAIKLGLVDELKSREEQRQYLIDLVGYDRDEESFKRVGFRTYLYSAVEEEETDAPNVAIVTAAGTIVDGNLPVGVAAGDRIAKHLRDARLDDDIRAVVLRVDSGGGSAFASEVIRQEVLALRDSGKPVVVSMGSLAASGGYWISANADEIWAAPTTITGSIGIFGMIQTFENTAAMAGVYSDGVGTTELSGIYGAGLGPLPQDFSDVMQASTEAGYERFLKIVGESRGYERDEIDAIAQGRVWIGQTAQELGLVDELGYLDDAVAAAAELADIGDDYDVVRIEDEKSRFEVFLEALAGQSVRWGLMDVEEPLFAGRNGTFDAKGLASVIADVKAEAEYYATFNDPNALYARCLECEPR